MIQEDKITRRKKQKAEAQKRYKKTEKGKKTQAKYFISDKHKEASKRWRAKAGNDVKLKAHKLVDKAIKLGFLTRLPCEVCASSISQAHHEDYNKPLDVIWLCPKHHSDIHRNNVQTKTMVTTL